MVSLSYRFNFYPSPSSGDGYSDRQLTLNFELWVEHFVCRHVSIRGFQNRVCLSVRTPRKEIALSFVNISPTLVIDTSMEKSSWVLQHGNPKIWYFSSKNVEIEFWLLFWLVPKSWNHLSFVNISPTLVIGTSMWSSRVLYQGKSKIRFYKKNMLNCLCFCCHVLSTIFTLYCAHWLVLSCYP